MAMFATVIALGGLYVPGGDSVFSLVVLAVYGLGGIFVEALKDVTFRVAPFDVVEAHEMIREINAYPILTGLRGQAPSDVEALVDAICSLANFAHVNRDTIAGVDINPFLVRPKGHGAVALDALIVPK